MILRGDNLFSGLWKLLTQQSNNHGIDPAAVWVGAFLRLTPPFDGKGLRVYNIVIVRSER